MSEHINDSDGYHGSEGDYEADFDRHSVQRNDFRRRQQRSQGILIS